MKAIILSAGQGRRLLPYTSAQPKCLLPVQGQRSVLDVQLAELERCGVRRVSVMVGFGADAVDRAVTARRRRRDIDVTTVFNPFFDTSDNLVTTWLARPEMTEDFVLLNGDTLFEGEVLRRMLAGSRGPVTIAMDRKPVYDEDDMKVSLHPDGRMRAIGKTLDASETQGEAIGMSVFRGGGVTAFRNVLDKLVRDPASKGSWYTSALGHLAKQTRVQPVSVQALWWAEIDTPDDLDAAREGLRSLRVARRRATASWAAGR